MFRVKWGEVFDLALDEETRHVSENVREIRKVACERGMTNAVATTVMRFCFQTHYVGSFFLSYEKVRCAKVIDLRL